jgi:membrane-bound ClpP family serine protease
VVKVIDALNFIYHIGPFAATCFVVGLFLLLVETIHPGFGIPGLTGMALLFLGVFLSAQTLKEALYMTLIILGLLGVALSFILNSAKNGFLSKKIILKNTSVKESGYTGVADLSDFLGKEGKSLTILRPAGIADFNGVKLDVVTEGDFISKDTVIKVIKVEGRRIVVRAVV